MLNQKQDGSPVTRRIKIPEIDGDVWFTTNAYAEVANDVADLLASNLDAIQKVSEPADPGSYYGDEGENITIKVVGIGDGEYDNLTVLRYLDAGSVGTVLTVITNECISHESCLCTNTSAPTDRSPSNAPTASVGNATP